MEERTGVEPACPGGHRVSTGAAYGSPHLAPTCKDGGRWESRTPKTPRDACPVSSGVGLPPARTFPGSIYGWGTRRESKQRRDRVEITVCRCPPRRRLLVGA